CRSALGMVVQDQLPFFTAVRHSSLQSDFGDWMPGWEESYTVLVTTALTTLHLWSKKVQSAAPLRVPTAARQRRIRRRAVRIAHTSASGTSAGRTVSGWLYVPLVSRIVSA